MKLSLPTLAISIASFLTMGSATFAAAATLSADDKNFITNAAQAGMTEVNFEGNPSGY